MLDDKQGFLTRAFLQREWATDYKAWRGSEAETALLARLKAWAARPDLKETSAEAAFIQAFFVETWGYALGGTAGGAEHTAYPQHPVAGAGAGGAAGSADLALGWFGEGTNPVPQVLCEFKDIRADLDAPQARKGNTRSPVKQAHDYLSGARRLVFGNEPVVPLWAVVTDMNEFRLYWWNRPQAFVRFTVNSPGLLPDLLGADEDTRFDRFAFARLFHRDLLLSRGGPPALVRLIEKQGAPEKKLEGAFYQDYRAVRERLFTILRLHNPAYETNPARLLRLAQKILDRFIFAFYCEDMGDRMLFPPQVIRDLLVARSKEPLFDEGRQTIWDELKSLFGVMDAGGRLGQVNLRAFNGGLFRHDPEIEALSLPNMVFTAAGQGANPNTIKGRPDTLLHLCASYNYAARGDATESIGLYTLGRIFEQSITELEKREAELDQRPSLTVLAKRKLPTRRSQGVYYTPEWVVERIVEGALDPWFAEAKAAAGWPGEAPATAEQLDAYARRVADVRVVDPACGSGAFLIGAFRRLLREAEEIDGYRRALNPATPPRAEREMTAAILDRNLYGVDISGPAVEIAKLALWLHSARADAPLSSLDGAVKCGNSLVGADFELWRQRDFEGERERERVNAFDWATAFPFGVDPGRFDIVVGNPPYVKRQHLEAANPDVANYLRAAREGQYYRSTQTGNWDLYLPFVEKGLDLLRPGGRMGYIAPSLWTVNEYGEGLRRLVRERRSLERWIDFKAHQVFDEAITYTALQFFTAAQNDAVEVVPAAGGEAAVSAALPWGAPERALSYDRLPEDGPWLMATGEERALIDRLAETCLRLDDPSLTSDIYQGVKTGADQVYKLQRVGQGRYRCDPDDRPSFEVEIEDSLMHPILSGPESKRYLRPRTETFLLFPYAQSEFGSVLIDSVSMENSFPLCWKYLTGWRPTLEARDGGALADEAWYRFSRSQSLNRNGTPKPFAAGTVPALRFSYDDGGTYFLTGGRVDGVVAAPPTDGWYLLGCLNGPTCNFVFKRVGRIKQGGWFEANRQFIAPLPIPRATPEAQASIGRRARALQRLHTRKRDLTAEAAARLAVAERAAIASAGCGPTCRRPRRWRCRRPGQRSALLSGGTGRAIGSRSC